MFCKKAKGVEFTGQEMGLLSMVVNNLPRIVL